jgi:hypothetical protein
VSARQLQALVRPLASRINELLQCEANIACDLSEQRGRDVSALVNRNCSDATIGVAELFVRTALANLSEAQPLQPCHDLTRLEDRWLGQESRHDSLDADELGFKLRFAIFEQEGDDLFQVSVEFVERLGLAVSAGKTRDIADVQAGIGITLHDGGISLHGRKDTERRLIVPAA